MQKEYNVKPLNTEYNFYSFDISYKIKFWLKKQMKLKNFNFFFEASASNT